MSLIYGAESYKVLGACFEVYTELGCGFLEAVYQESLELELKMQGIPFLSQQGIDIHYKNQKLFQKYIPDFICFSKIILEIKAVKELSDIHRAQLINSLKITGYKVGYLVNFSHYPKLEYERMVYT